MKRTPPKTFLPELAPAGSTLEEHTRAAGHALGDALSRLVAALPGAPLGPQKLATLLGTTIVNTSRLLRAISHSDAIAVLRHVPGPDPLRRIVTSSRNKGVAPELVVGARDAIDRFDALIRAEGGNRGAFDAIISAWLPEERRKFEARRRQSAFKALSELRGCSTDHEVASLLVWPSDDPQLVDVACLQALYGLKRMRPGVRVKLGTRRMTNSNDDPRRPTNLDGEPAVDGIPSVRLDHFCMARPAPLEARTFGSDVLYTLGETGFGQQSAVDIIIGEVNRNELPSEPVPGRRRYFFHIVSTPTRRVLFDLFVHRSLFKGDPEFVVYDTTGIGPADANESVHDIDRVEITEELQVLGHGADALHGAGISRYPQLVTTAVRKLGWELEALRGYRVCMEHPLVGMQLCLVFPRV